MEGAGRATWDDTVPPEDLANTVLLKSCDNCRRNFTSSLLNCPDCGVQLQPFALAGSLIGTCLRGKYTVQELIGQGGMGTVYRGWHEQMKRPVAIKVLRPHLINDEGSIKRFRQEAIAASRLKHPNIITVYDIDETEGGQLYLVMDLLEGTSVADLIKEKGYITADRALNIFSQVCAALGHAHRNGVIHRDLKPGNVMICPTENDKDFVKLVDFGIAKVSGGDEQTVTQKGEIFGSPLYMSPEQCLGKQLDGRSDVYSLGVVMYEALTGFPPLMGENMIATIDLQIHTPPEPFTNLQTEQYIPERLQAAVLKALEKDPASRQQTMEQLGIELDMAAAKKNVAVSRGLENDADKLKRVNRVLMFSLILCAIAAGVGWAGFSTFSSMHLSLPTAGVTFGKKNPQTKPRSAQDSASQAGPQQPDAETPETAEHEESAAVESEPAPVAPSTPANPGADETAKAVPAKKTKTAAVPVHENAAPSHPKAVHVNHSKPAAVKPAASAPRPKTSSTGDGSGDRWANFRAQHSN